jgi:hypothetical protein
MAKDKLNPLRIWEQVCETDPNNTRAVKHRGGFTTIDAYSQIEMATKVFGPVGTGWWWHFDEPIFVSDCVVVKCNVHYVDPETGVQCKAPVEQFGQKTLAFKNKPDEDALKKAGTDALTKCLSYLGFNADVFLGKFDDNKYLERMHEKYRSPVVDELAGLIDACANLDMLADAGAAIADAQLENESDKSVLRNKYFAKQKELEGQENE